MYRKYDEQWSEMQKRLVIALLKDPNISLYHFSKDNDVPLTTIQRWRKRLFEHFLTKELQIRFDALGNKQLIQLTIQYKGENTESIYDLLADTKAVMATQEGITDIWFVVIAQMFIESRLQLASIITALERIPSVAKVTYIEILTEKVYSGGDVFDNIIRKKGLTSYVSSKQKSLP